MQAAIAAAEQRLEKRGRVLIRPSGTEPVIRVMAEAEEESIVEETVHELAALIRARAAAGAVAERPTPEDKVAEFAGEAG